MTCSPRLTTLSFASSCLRQHILAVKLGVSFLDNPACYGHAGGPYSGFRPSPESLIAGYFVPDNRWFERLGGCYPPGLSGVLADPWPAGQPLILCLFGPSRLASAAGSN